MQLIAVCVLLLTVVVTMVHSEITFAEFKRQFNKSYSHRRVMNGNGMSQNELRKKIFEHNLEHIHELNQKQNGSFGVNRFADETPEEFKRTHMGVQPPTQADIDRLNRDAPRLRRTQASTKLPAEWDWEKRGYVIPPKNQGSCGSCWAFSVVGALESYYMRKGFSPRYLSEQQVVDCDKSNGGCNGGWPPRALLYVQKNGLQTERDYPYRARNQQCAYNKNKVNLPKPVGFYQVADEKTLLEALYLYGPMPIVLNADKFQFYRGGIFDATTCPPVNGINHAVLLVGYGTENGVDFWRIKNSWGTGWGEEGYIRLKRNENTCNMMMYPTVAISK